MTRKTIRVRAGQGLTVHLPLDVAAAPGRQTRTLVGEEIIEVPADNRFVQRRLLVGDLVEVKAIDPDMIKPTMGGSLSTPRKG